MGLILDSSVVIAAERFGQSAYQMIEALGFQTGDSELAVSVVTVMELAHGVTRANNSQRRGARQRFLDDLLVGAPVHPVSVAIGLRAGEIDGDLQAKGIRVAVGDLLIGSTALELGYSVLTHNTRHFEAIPDLTVVRL